MRSSEEEWADEVLRRYIRRRDRVRQREKAWAELRAAVVELDEYRVLERAVAWLARRVE